MIAARQVHRVAISNVPRVQVDPPDSSQAPARVPSTRPAADLQDLAAQARLVGGPDLAHVPASALRVPEALAHDLAPAELRRPVRHHARSARHRIALAAADSSTPRPRKVQ